MSLFVQLHVVLLLSRNADGKDIYLGRRTRSSGVIRGPWFNLPKIPHRVRDGMIAHSTVIPSPSAMLRINSARNLSSVESRCILKTNHYPSVTSALYRPTESNLSPSGKIDP